MSVSRVEAIANAVLYEGYMLYPYRASAIKNRQRFNFGVVVPEAKPQSAYSSELSCMATECLISGPPELEIAVSLRFLQLVQRDVLIESQSEQGQQGGFVQVASAEVDGALHAASQEAMERNIASGSLTLSDLIQNAWRKEFDFHKGSEIEEVRDKQGRTAASLVRSHETVRGYVTASCVRLDRELFKLTVKIVNTSEFHDVVGGGLATSLLSTHIVLRATGGRFFSLTDPPEEVAAVARSCQNKGVWPVLAGDTTTDADVLLASPIILSDYPEIAPESTGDLFDGTEIDEILALRILTLTDEEKREMRSDKRTRMILDRTEQLQAEQFLKLHGTLRAVAPANEEQG